MVEHVLKIDSVLKLKTLFFGRISKFSPKKYLPLVSVHKVNLN